MNVASLRMLPVLFALLMMALPAPAASLEWDPLPSKDANNQISGGAKYTLGEGETFLSFSVEIFEITEHGNMRVDGVIYEKEPNGRRHTIRSYQGQVGKKYFMRATLKYKDREGRIHTIIKEVQL